MVPSARARSSSSMAGASSGVVTARISTLSNSWARSMPRVSRPAEPASRRKHGVYAISRTGRRSSSIVSSRYSDVSGTSAVGIAHRSSRSIVKASSANFGSWPEAVSVAVVTSDGGRISSKASALRSRASWHRARPIVAPRPRVIVNIAPLTLIARSLSRMPRAAPVSQCGTWRWAAKASGRPTGPCTTGLSASDAPSGASGWGRLGMPNSSPRRSSAIASCSVSSWRWRSPSARLSAPSASAAATSPSRRSWPTRFDISLIRALVSSRSAVTTRDRASSSAAARSWSSSSGRPRRAIAASVASSSVRSRRTSITGPRPYRRPPADSGARIRAGALDFACGNRSGGQSAGSWGATVRAKAISTSS